MAGMKLKGPWPKLGYTVGVDLGQTMDPTAICILETKIVPVDDWTSLRAVETQALYNCRHLERLPLGITYPAQVQHIAGLLQRPPLTHLNWKKTNLVVDQTGVGRAVFDIFKQTGLRPKGVTITAGRQVVKKNDEYHVPKLELVSRLQAAFHSKTLKIADDIPDAKVLATELQNFRANFTSVGNVIFNAREGQHDDLVLATAIALWWAEGSYRPTFRRTSFAW